MKRQIPVCPFQCAILFILVCKHLHVHNKNIVQINKWTHMMGTEGEVENMEQQTRHDENNLDGGTPSVQEMIRLNPEVVPVRYILNEEDRPRTCPVPYEIPRIDVALLASGNEEERQKLDFACKEWGFFQIINHGIEDTVLSNMKAATNGFFELPLDKKKKYAIVEDDVQGYGKGYVFDEDQKLDWSDSILMMTQPTEKRNMKFWPTVVPNFFNAVDEYSREVERVAVEILANISLLMGLERDALKEKHITICQGLGMNYYPPCARPDLVMGVSAHSDISSLTFLLQDDHVTGLQIKHNGEWVPVKPIPNAVVVNVGDSLEAWSNGMYKSINHRAVPNQNSDRISVATFVIPAPEATLGPMETMVDDSNPSLYKDMNYLEYALYTISQKLEGKANIDYLKF